MATQGYGGNVYVSRGETSRRGARPSEIWEELNACDRRGLGEHLHREREISHWLMLLRGNDFAGRLEWGVGESPLSNFSHTSDGTRKTKYSRKERDASREPNVREVTGEYCSSPLYSSFPLTLFTRQTVYKQGDTRHIFAHGVADGWCSRKQRALCYTII